MTRRLRRGLNAPTRIKCTWAFEAGVSITGKTYAPRFGSRKGSAALISLNLTDRKRRGSEPQPTRQRVRQGQASADRVHGRAARALRGLLGRMARRGQYESTPRRRAIGANGASGVVYHMGFWPIWPGLLAHLAWALGLLSLRRRGAPGRSGLGFWPSWPRSGLGFWPSWPGLLAYSLFAAAVHLADLAWASGHHPLGLSRSPRGHFRSRSARKAASDGKRFRAA